MPPFIMHGIVLSINTVLHSYIQKKPADSPVCGLLAFRSISVAMDVNIELQNV